MSGGTSEASSLYGHAHSTIVPFLSASSGSPAPTFHSCRPLATTESPAARAAKTSSTHVLSVARLEMRIDLGSVASEPHIALYRGRHTASAGAAAPQCLITTT